VRKPASPWLPLVSGVGLLLALSLPLAGPLLAQTTDQNLWISDATVTCMARSGNTLYIGGNFSQVGPATGSGVPIDAGSGLPVVGFPTVDGTIETVIADGSSGWYIGGSFNYVGGLPRTNLAQILSDNTVASWNPGADGTVFALALSGGTLYVGGQFANVGGAARNNMAAVDVATGIPISPWSAEPDGRVVALLVNGASIYVGGFFSNIGGASRSYAAAVSANGVATAWNPGAGGYVYTLGISGSTIYLGGQFALMGGQPRSNIAAVNASSALATTWNPSANSDVLTLQVSGSTVYAGGYFTNLGGQPRDYVAALDITTGAARPWNANADFLVHDVEVSGSTVYVGGWFTTIGGQARKYLAALDATTAAATAWNPNPSDYVQSLAVSGTTIYAGGYYRLLGGVARGRLAALDLTTGQATAWDPNASVSVVYCLAVSGTKVYVGGGFDTVGGQAREHLAALDATTGLATSWNPGCDGVPLAFGFSATHVYVAGSFTTIGGQSRTNLAALDPTTGLATSWAPHITGGDVNAVAVSGSKVYIGGFFSEAAFASRSRIAAIDASTGAATSWNPTVDDAGGWVNTLVVSGNTIYAGGGFTSIGGQSRSNVAALDAGTGLATAWDPSPNGPLRAVALSGATVYIGGDFTSVGGQSRDNLAALDATSGLASAWNPILRGGPPWVLEVSGAKTRAGGDFTSVGLKARASLTSMTASPALSAVTPARGGNLGPVTVAVTGSDLPSGAAVKLTRSGQADIPGAAVVVRTDALGLSATFDLSGAAIGSWNVVVTTPDLQTATLTNGFTVEAAAPHQLRADILGRSSMRPDRRRAFDLVIENLGNNDALSVPLWIARIPANATIDFDFPVASPPQSAGEPNWSTVPLTLNGPGGKYAVLVIPRLPPGVTTRRFYISVPNSVTSLRLDAALAPPWLDGNVFRSCLSGAGVITNPSCMGSQLTAIHTYLAASSGISALSGIGLWAKIAWQCEGAATLPAALTKAEQVLDYMLQPVEGVAVPAGCAVPLTPQWQDSIAIKVVTSVDPNEKLGAGGVGPTRLIGIRQLVPYSIQFENQQSASAPAQDVLVLDGIDVTKFDMSTASLSQIKFGKRANGQPWTIEPPPGLSNYATDLDLRPDLNVVVRVGFTLDRATGSLACSMTSLDPATGLSPENAQVGFLPPNLTAPQGEGSLALTVLPKPGLANGTVISNQASIVFDGVTLGTAAWSNTIDTGAPLSHVLPLGATQDSTNFTVRWVLDGAYPDFRDYSVYVSQNGGAYRPWRLHVRGTADTIGASRGGNFAFYSVARDSSGNLEVVPVAPDAQTFARVGVDDPVVAGLAFEGVAPNPAAGEAHAWFTLASRERAVLEVIDVAGRRVMRRDVSSLGPGRHTTEVGSSMRAPGLYFLRLTQGGETVRARVVKMR
jgi:hypothetical protein